MDAAVSAAFSEVAVGLSNSPKKKRRHMGAAQFDCFEV
jgi:hypothetical protein